MMNKDELLALLEKKGISFKIQYHEAMYSMADCNEENLLYPLWDAKNLFLRDDKKKNYYLLTLKGNHSADLKEFQLSQGTRRLSFASEGDMMEFLHLTPGSVTPFGLLNGAKPEMEEKTLSYYLDDYFDKEEALIGCHPNDNTATVWLKVKDLKALLVEAGFETRFFHVMD